MSIQYLYEVSTPSFHKVPHSPFIRAPSTIASSPVATVPDVDTNKSPYTANTSYIGRSPQTFTNLSPLPSGQVPSISPRTPLNHPNNMQSREQQVPSQTPIRRKSNQSCDNVPTLDLFTDENCIFL